MAMQLVHLWSRPLATTKLQDRLWTHGARHGLSYPLGMCFSPPYASSCGRSWLCASPCGYIVHLRAPSGAACPEEPITAVASRTKTSACKPWSHSLFIAIVPPPIATQRLGQFRASPNCIQLEVGLVARICGLWHKSDWANGEEVHLRQLSLGAPRSRKWKVVQEEAPRSAPKRSPRHTNKTPLARGRQTRASS